MGFGAGLIGLASVVDTARDHDHSAFCDVLGEAFVDAVGAGDPVLSSLGRAVAFAFLEAEGCDERNAGD